MKDREIILTKNRGWFPTMTGAYVLVYKGVIQGRGFDTAEEARHYALKKFRETPIFQERLPKTPTIEREGRYYIVHKEFAKKHPRQPKEGFETSADAYAHFNKEMQRARKWAIRFIEDREGQRPAI